MAINRFNNIPLQTRLDAAEKAIDAALETCTDPKIVESYGWHFEASFHHFETPASMYEVMELFCIMCKMEPLGGWEKHRNMKNPERRENWWNTEKEKHICAFLKAYL